MADGGGKELTGWKRKEPDTAGFLQNYYTTYGGGPGGGGLDNSRYRESLSGFYNQQPFEAIAENLSKVNTFIPRAKPIFKSEGGGIHPLGLF